MKVILTKKVNGVGNIHDTVNVSDGYALNFLIRKGVAISATPVAQRLAKARKEKLIAEKGVQEQLFAQNIATLAEANIVITAKANEKNHLYDAVGIPEILSALEKQLNITFPKDTIKLEQPIKEIGKYDISISHEKYFGKFSITVEQE